MKRLLILSLIAVLALVPSIVMAQSAAPGANVTQTGSTGLAAGTCLVVGGGSSVSATAQAVLTVPSPGGNNSIYFDYLVATLNTIATPVSSAGALSFTSTNIAGTPVFPVSMFGSIASGGAVIPAAGANGPLAIPIKATAGSSPVITGPTANATYGQTIVGCWHSAP